MMFIDVFTDGYNMSALIALLVRLTAILVIAVYVLPVQIKDICKGYNDGLQRLRYIILSFLTMYMLFSVPPFIYQMYRFFGENYALLLDVASICSSLSILSISVWLVLLYTYTRKVRK